MRLLLTLLILAAQAAANETRHPDAAKVFHCGFEEAADCNFDSWPDGWTRRRGPNFPAYLPVKIVEAAGAEGQLALRLGLNGGGACISSSPIEVGTVYSYVLEAYLKTEGLKNDRAWVSLSFLDAEGRVLETYASEQFQSVPDWKKLQLGPLTATSEQVKSAVINLHVEPVQDIPDLRGAALFDDVWLGRLPRMSLRTNRPDNIYVDASQVDIQCQISGIHVQDPVMRCELLDVYGNAVGEPSLHRLQREEAPGLASRNQLLSKQPVVEEQHYFHSMHWKPQVPEPGFYRARVTLEGTAESVLERQLTLAVIEPRKAARGGEFGWTLPHGGRPLSYATLAQLLPQLGLSWTKFPVWLDGNQVEKLDELVEFAERLSLQGVESVGLLADPPAEMRPHFGDVATVSAAAIFSTSPEVWYTSLEPATTRLSMQVRWWQLGHDSDTSFVGDSQIIERVARVKKQLEQFGQTAHVGLPWDVMHETPGGKELPWDFVYLWSQPSLTTRELASYLPEPANEATQRWVAIEPLPRGSYSLEQRASDLVHRMVAAKRHGARGIFVPNPFDSQRGLMNDDGTPGELMLPWRNTALALSGAEFIGSLRLAEGSRNYVFARGSELVMVLWNPLDVEERLFLGENARQIDVWGRSRVPRQEDHEHVFAVGPLPSLVVNLSEPIVRWMMSFRFQNAQLPSVFGRSHQNAVRLKNFFPQGTSGQVRLHTPDVWQTTPQVMNLKLAAGEELREPFTIRLPFDATNGVYPIRVDFEIAADREYRFSVYRELEVGLGDVTIEMDSHLTEQGDLEVEAYFTNKTDGLLSFKCSLFAPDRRRLVGQVTRLGSQRDTKRFRFPDGKELIGKPLWLRAEEIGGDRTFNYRMMAKE